MIHPELLAEIQRTHKDAALAYTSITCQQYYRHVSALLGEVLCPTCLGEGQVPGAMPGGKAEACRACDGNKVRPDLAAALQTERDAHGKTRDELQAQIDQLHAELDDANLEWEAHNRAAEATENTP